MFKRIARALPASIKPAVMLATTVLAQGCERRPDDVPVQVSMIEPGDTPRGDGGVDAMLALATAQGLVRYDAAGGIEPALAERWIVTDHGRSIIFRLADLHWPDGRVVTAGDVAAALRRALRNPDGRLAPYLSAIDEVVAMTPQVIEVRLSRARPDLLNLFAQPELTVPAPGSAPGARIGSGPFRVIGDRPTGTMLEPVDAPATDADGDAERREPEDFVRVRPERASVAVLRFVNGKSDLVAGGSYLDWPIAVAARVSPPNVRVDGAAGLFGLAIVRRVGLLADRTGRAAVAMAIDRGAATGAVRSDWLPVDTLLPDRLDSAMPPTPPPWTALGQADRAARVAARIVAFRRQTGTNPRLRIAMPAGPGANLVYGQVGTALRRAGIDTDRVALSDPAADLRLIDAVAPYDSARWYLHTACQPCSEPIATLIGAIREAPDLPTRGRLLARADGALASDIAFITIARPLRWSLVATRLRSWTANARAIHPLNHLRRPPT